MEKTTVNTWDSFAIGAKQFLNDIVFQYVPKLIMAGTVAPGDTVTMKYDEEQKQIIWDIDSPDEPEASAEAEAPKAPSAPETPEAPSAPETSEAPEAPETTETPKDE